MMWFFDDAELVVAFTTVFFFGLLIYLRVPGKITALLDARADKIRGELDEARKLREEAQTLLASYEKKQKEVETMAEHIVGTAKAEAERAAAEAHENLKHSIERRLKAAEDQIASAEASAVKEVRDSAIIVATDVAAKVIAEKMSAKSANAMIDASIKEVGAKLH